MKGDNVGTKWDRKERFDEWNEEDEEKVEER